MTPSHALVCMSSGFGTSGLSALGKLRVAGAERSEAPVLGAPCVRAMLAEVRAAGRTIALCALADLPEKKQKSSPPCPDSAILDPNKTRNKAFPAISRRNRTAELR